MNRFVVTLKQHTPLIHFQHYQNGATLRATELKPKLDRFIIKNCFNDNYEEYKKYLIGYDEGKINLDLKERKALDYKVKICNVKNREVKDIGKKFTDKNGKIKEGSYPLFFANMNVENEFERKKFIYCDSLDVEFFSFKKELIEKIIDILPSFLMQNNFGMRQSKGFGSFFINENGEYVFNGKPEKYTKEQIDKAKQLKYKFIVSDTKNSKDKIDIYRNLFKTIENFYKSLRSGLILFNSQNKKIEVLPCIKLYFNSKKIQWEKDVIKQTYGYIRNYENGDYEKLLIKDLFGLSTFEYWKQQDWKITKEDCCNDNNDKITRFKSPIFFKPLINKDGCFEVYFEAKKIDARFLNREFTIKCNGKGNLVLRTPKEFDFDDFFKYVKKQASNKNLPYYIRNVYEQL